ncbi:unnamed protein product, partial [Phaeothamnion confervicola]
LIAVAIAAIITLVWLLFELFAPTFETSLDASKVSHHAGHRYNTVLVLRKWQRIYSLPSDGQSDQHRSKLELYENGVPLGPAHVLHKEIEDLGEGRYSHWG